MQGEKELTGMLDRFEDGNQVVIIIEEAKKEVIVSKEELPAGSKEGMWFLIYETDKFEIHSIDHKRTIKENEKVNKLIKQLRQLK